MLFIQLFRMLFVNTRKYSLEMFTSVAQDWHMSLNEGTTCTEVSCDMSRCGGPWNDLVLATSRDYINERGAHDASTWGKLYIR